MLFRKWGCLVGPENSIFRKLKSVDQKKNPLTTEMLLHFYFPFKAFPENERERERERESVRQCAKREDPVRDRELQLQSEIASSSSSPRSRSRRSRRDLAKARSRSSRDRAVNRDLREIAPSIAISRRRRDRDRAVDRNPNHDRTIDRNHAVITIAPWSWSRCGLCFLICVFRFVFSFFFSKHQKIFSEKFFEMQPNTWKHFPFPENMYFPENVLQQPNTALTKHVFDFKNTRKLFFLYIPKNKFFSFLFFFSFPTRSYLNISTCLLYKAVFGCCKTFSGKYIFSGNANVRKRKMFSWCLVAL